MSPTSRNTLSLLLLLLVFLCQQILCRKIIRTVAGVPQFRGNGILAKNALFFNPSSVFVTPTQELYIADTGNHVVRKIHRNGIITTIAGVVGRARSSDTGVDNTNIFTNPSSVLVTDSNDVFVADERLIQKVLPGRKLEIIAGTLVKDEFSYSGPTNTSIGPKQMQIWKNNFYFCDSSYHVIRVIFENGTMSTIAGQYDSTRTTTFGGDGGPALNAVFNRPHGLLILPNDDIIIADSGNNVIRRIFATNGTITTVAGNKRWNWNDTISTHALNTTLSFPKDLYLMPDESILISDYGNHAIRKLYLNGSISTIAGIAGNFTRNGTEGIATQSLLYEPNACAHPVTGDVFIADHGSNLIRKVDWNTGYISTLAGANTVTDPKLAALQLNRPSGVYVTSKRIMYISDRVANVVKMVNETGAYVVAGVLNSAGYNGDNITATSAFLQNPNSVFFNEATDELFITDMNNNIIRKVKNGIITTVAGNRLFSSTGTLATETSLRQPQSIFVSKSNELYIADSSNRVVRKVLTNGTVVNFAGNGGYEVTGDGGLAIGAGVPYPSYIFVTESNEVYISLALDRCIRKVYANGTISTFVGKFGQVKRDLSSPNQIAVSPITNELFFMDDGAKLYRVSSNQSQIEIIAGIPLVSAYSAEEDISKVTFYDAKGLFISTTGSIYIADTTNSAVRKITNVCNQYIFDFDLNINGTSKDLLVVNSKINRTCIGYVDYFDADYLPQLQLLYKDTYKEFQSFDLYWGDRSQITASMTSQYLDIISVVLDGCYAYDNILSECNVTKEYVTIPTKQSDNFLFFPRVTTAEFINYYRISSFVSLFEIHLSFFNTMTNQIDKSIIITKASYSEVITSLKHSTTYNVSIVTQVQYTNGQSFTTTPIFKSMTTEVGIYPGKIPNLSMTKVNDAFVVTWEAPLELGNEKVDRLELEYRTKIANEETSIITIPNYNAYTNTPDSYLLLNIPQNMNFSIRLRACSNVGCGNYTDPIQGIVLIDDNINSIGTLLGAIFGIIGVVVLFFCVLVLILVITLAIVMLKMKPKQKTITSNVNQELITISKEFRIDESKLDFSNSIAIGSGANGSVFTAKYFNNYVAVKMVPKSSLGVENDLSEFYNEMKVLTQITQHANIIRYFGVYETVQNNCIGLVMELCSNGSVANYLHQSQLEISFETKLKLIQGIASGMEYLHHYNIAHRDLKCENVLLDDHLTPKIIDFGYSREITEQSNNLTMNVGTAAYCAPEVIKSQINTTNTSLKSMGTIPLQSSSAVNELAYSKQIDVYSFAIVMYVIYFRKTQPYGNVNDNQILFQLLQNVEKRPTIDEAMIPSNEQWLIELIKQCWSTSAEAIPSFTQICNILQRNSSTFGKM